MAKIQFLTILLTVTCFLAGVVSITDKEFEDLVRSVHHQAETIRQLSINDNRQSDLIQQLERENKVMMEEMKRQDALIQELTTRGSSEGFDKVMEGGDEMLLNNTIEERVTLLEIQVMDIREDLTTIEQNVSDLDEDVNFLFDETVLQDERILTLEQDNDVINQKLENLQDMTLALDFRVTALEENGGDGGNSSVAELEVRVETLEGTATDHETRITTSESDIGGLDENVSEFETRLVAAEENIQGLQMTDVELNARVTALEENGGGNGQNGTFAFHTVLTEYSSIPTGAVVEFNEVLLNQGGGYQETTGIFTVPPGGDGFYYFSVYLVIPFLEYGRFDIQINGESLCTAYTDQNQVSSDPGQATCNAASYATEGDEVWVVYRSGTDTTPLYLLSGYYYNGFTGFRI